MTSNAKKLVYFENWCDPVAEEILNAAPGIELIRLTQDQDEDTVFEVMREAHGYQMLAKTEMQVRWRPNRAFIEKCPNLLAIASLGAGYDACDDAACTEHGIMVVNNSGANSDSVAQHAIGMLLALSKNMIRHDRMMREAPGLDRMTYPGLETTDKTLGIIGLGNIGRRTAKIARHALDLNVIAYDPYISDQDFADRNAEKASFEDVFKNSDYISVHCPLTDETRGMIGAEAFAMMKPSAYFITTARGGIHDEAALVAALAAKQMDGAGVDVFDQEPPGPGHPLMQFQNVLMTPHAAGITDVCNHKMAKWGAEQWIEILNGRRPPRLVNPTCWDAYVERHTKVTGQAPSS
ncbi:hydroxyacid dehydrogenase [Rhodospirillales bacterium]|nr:hydroxyacid dehydrogenase [Rhodospirillales bacterium]